MLSSPLDLLQIISAAHFFAGDRLEYQILIIIIFLVPGVMLTRAANTPPPLLRWSFNTLLTNPAVVAHQTSHSQVN